jgi:hypothetical protein
MPPRVQRPTEFDPLSIPYQIDHANMSASEVSDMTTRVLAQVRYVMKDAGDFNRPVSWSALADEISVACDLADNKRYQQRSAWSVMVGKAFAAHVNYTKRFSLEFIGRTSNERLNIWVFYC